MKKMLLVLAALLLTATFSNAAESEKETKEDIAKHRAIAAAHEAAAKCREAGKGEQGSQKEEGRAHTRETPEVGKGSGEG